MARGIRRAALADQNLFVDLVLALFPYIVASLFFTGTSSDCTKIVTIGAELAVPELLLYSRNWPNISRAVMLLIVRTILVEL